jgi:hypothetical protein
MATPRTIALAALLFCACTPQTPEQQARDAARAAVEASQYTAPDESGHLSPAALAQAQAGTLKGYRDDAARLSVHYLMDTRTDPAERRRWLTLAAATGSSQAIQNDLDMLRLSGTPTDCGEARVLIAKAKVQYTHEIATAQGQDRREEKAEALEALRSRERQMDEDACGTAGR